MAKPYNQLGLFNALVSGLLRRVKRLLYEWNTQRLQVRVLVGKPTKASVTVRNTCPSWRGQSSVRLAPMGLVTFAVAS